MDYAAVGITLVGSVLIARRDIRGFYAWILANVLWVPWSIVQHHYSITAMNLVYFVINVYGVRNWRRRAEAHEKRV